MITQKELTEQLSRIGIRSADTVMLHTSLRALGPVEGGADGVINAFKACLSDGLLVIPTHTWDRLPRYIPYYNVEKDAPCVGTLPTVAAYRPDGVRSLHPSHSVTAFGTDAEDFVAGEEKMETPCDPRGVTKKLLERDAKILLLGVGQTNNTFLHGVEEILDAPRRTFVDPVRVTIIGREGEIHHTDFRRHCRGVSRYFSKFEDIFIALGAVRIVQVGEARSELCSCRKIFSIVRHIYGKTDRDLLFERGPIPFSYWSDYSEA